MSAQSVAFESINLDPSIAQFPPQAAVSDTSDDGLDPEDFLSQQQTTNPNLEKFAEDSDAETSLERDPESGLPLAAHIIALNGATPTLSNLLNLLLSRDSLLFSFGNLKHVHPSDQQKDDSPLEHLLERESVLNNDMSTAIRLHKELLESGEDCTAARRAISKLFAAFSETSMLLQEMYTREVSRVHETLASFQAWEKKRTKVLLRIKKIKSENNEYGAKLKGLLTQQTSIDSEIESLEQRLDLLRSNRSAIDREVGETMSVLESKSARYVNMFRNLENAGVDAVQNYLGTEYPRESKSTPLIRYEPVDVGFTPETKPEHGNIEPAAERGQPQDSSRLRFHEPPILPEAMGAQPFELPSEELQKTHAHDSKKDSSAYNRGFAKGSEQLSAVKNKLSHLLLGVVPLPQKSSKDSATFKHLSDSLNTITQKLDLRPVLDMLVLKRAALDDLVLQTARTAEKYHKIGLKWSELSLTLETKEELLLQLLSQSLNMTEAERVLQQIYTYLRATLEEISNQSYPQTENKEDYLRLLISQELLTAALALDQISNQDSYVSAVRSSNGFLTRSAKGKPRDLRYSITSISSHKAIPEIESISLATRPTRKTTKYPSSSAEKGTKYE
ncbi:hypothetical protein METSCH_B04990 [Metschnikowia aff. pulcherrima]|uniref:Uncharacterized protein n=1 Tax=Metschnikowia aff. pulcherrima TaxID=2163413 RepID=A0A4P6XJ56_9ASCO|nr:hypothetical protein METSCH_B04990 [Metschnikowia aff. pulcherrima]